MDLALFILACAGRKFYSRPKAEPIITIGQSENQDNRNYPEDGTRILSKIGFLK